MPGFRILFLFYLLISFSFAQNPKIIVVADEWCPYNCAPNSPSVGFFIDILTEIYGKDYEIDYIVKPWGQAVSMVKNGEAHILLGSSKEEAVDLLYPDEPITSSYFALYSSESATIHYNPNTKDIKNATIGITYGYSYPKELLELLNNKVNNNQVVLNQRENALGINYELLTSKKIQAFVEIEPIIKWYQANSSPLKIKKLFKFNTKYDYYFAFSPKLSICKTYLDIYNKSITNKDITKKIKDLKSKYHIE
jgi:polar amino acid transport system substrate-binding protein